MTVQEKQNKVTAFAAVFLILAALAAHYLWDPWGFYWKVSQD